MEACGWTLIGFGLGILIGSLCAFAWVIMRLEDTEARWFNKSLETRQNFIRQTVLAMDRKPPARGR